MSRRDEVALIICDETKTRSAACSDCYAKADRILDPEAHAGAGELVAWVWDSEPGTPYQERHVSLEEPPHDRAVYRTKAEPLYTRPAPAAIPEGLRDSAVWIQHLLHGQSKDGSSHISDEEWKEAIADLDAALRGEKEVT